MKQCAVIILCVLAGMMAVANGRDEIDERIFATTPAPVSILITNGLMAHWTMDDNAANTTVLDSWSTNNGTAQQNTSVLTVPGKINGALSFDGSGDYISAVNNRTFSALTVSAWINATALGNKHILAFGSGAGSGDLFSTAVGWESGYGLENKICTGGYFGSWKITDSGVTVASNTWYHVASVCSSTNIAIFVNGEYKTQIAATFSVDSAAILIGRRNNNGYNFPGVIDDVRIYDRTLTTNEVYNISLGIGY